MIIKPVVNAMFLTRFGISRLPILFVLVALVAGVASRHYSLLLKSGDLFQLMRRSLLIMIGSLLLFRMLIHWPILKGSALFGFYIWIAVFSLISTSQFWILANTLFNPREAKRLFGFIGAGAIAGGIFGGYLVNFSVGLIGSENLIWICALCLFGCIPIPSLLRENTVSDEPLQKSRQEEQAGAFTEGPLALIRHSRHLSLLAGIIGISVLVGKLVEYQFNAIAVSEITDTDRLSAFFGFWLSNLNIVSFIIQLFITRRVVGAFGVGTALFILPGAILFGTLAVLFYPALWSAVLIKICDGSLKNSLNKAGIELLVLPIPIKVKNQAKTYIDVFIDSFFTGLSGLLLLLFTLGFDMSVRHISGVVLFLLAVWIYLVLLIRLEYVRSFRLKLASHPISSEQEIRTGEKNSIIEELIRTLSDASDETILRALRLAQEVKNDRFLPVFLSLLDHSVSVIRLESLRNLYLYPKNDFSEIVKARVRDPDLEVQTEALHYLFHHAGAGRVDMLLDFFRHEDRTVQGAALLCAARESRRNSRLKENFQIHIRMEAQIRQLQHISNRDHIDFTKILAARVIGTANIPDLYPYLYLILNDASSKVVDAAIIGAGETRRKRFIPLLIHHLGNPRHLKAAAEALSFFGPPVLDCLSACLDNPFAARDIRLRIPHVISHLGVQKSADLLMKYLSHHDLALRYEVILALNRLRTHFPELNFDNGRVVRTILEEAQEHHHLLNILYRKGSPASPLSAPENPEPPHPVVNEARQRLARLLEKRVNHSLERIFRLLGLKYPPQDIYDAYQNIRSHASDVRTNAIDFLDNLLEADLKKVVIPMVEISPIADHSPDLFDRKMSDEFECLAAILSGGDSALQIEALHLIKELRSDRYLSLAGNLINSPDPDVQKAARDVVMKIGYPL